MLFRVADVVDIEECGEFLLHMETDMQSRVGELYMNLVSSSQVSQQLYVVDASFQSRSEGTETQVNKLPVLEKPYVVAALVREYSVSTLLKCSWTHGSRIAIVCRLYHYNCSYTPAHECGLRWGRNMLALLMENTLSKQPYPRVTRVWVWVKST